MDNINQDEMIKKIQEINVKLNAGCDLNYLEENMPFVLNVGKFYDACIQSNKKDGILDCYFFFTKYFLMYMAKKYNLKYNYNIASDSNDTYYNPNDNSINISKTNIGKDFQLIVFRIFHEFRHRMQYNDMRQEDNRNVNTINDLMNIDPATIVFLKEVFTQADGKLYSANHDCFMMEHDANLFAISECKHFFKTDFIEKIYSGELNNYIVSMINGTNLSDQEYHNQQSLPIIYEQDYRYRNHIAGKTIPDNSLLSLIYNSNGKPKSYQELMEEKQRLIERFKGQSVNMKTSTTNYEKWSSPKSSEQHIEEIFKLIIASDPILTIQESLFKYNNIENKLIAKKWIDNVKTILEECPKIVDLYQSEIRSILANEIREGNQTIAQEIANEHPSLEFFVSNYIKLHPELIKSDKKHETEERTQEGHRISNNQRRPIISKAVQKQVLLRKEKEELINKKKQIEEYKRQQEIINQEETKGMTM